MLIKEKQNYLLSYESRDRSLTDLAELIIFNSINSIYSNSIVLSFNENEQEEIIKLVKSYASRIIRKTTKNVIIFENDSRILFRIIDKDLSVASFKGYFLSFLYVDYVQFEHADIMYSKMIEFVQYFCNEFYNLIITTNTPSSYLNNFKLLFLQKEYEIVIKTNTLPQTKYLVIIEGDMNDSDCVEKSFIIEDDINSPCFADFEDFENCKITYADIFNNFFPVITDLKKELSLTKYDSNWSDKVRDLFYNKLAEKLQNLIKDAPLDYLSDYLSELLQDFIPGNYDYPIHNINSIKLIPLTDNIITLKS